MTTFLSQLPDLTYDQFLDHCITRSSVQAVQQHYGLDVRFTTLLLRAFALTYYPSELITTPSLPTDQLVLTAAQALTSVAQADTKGVDTALTSFQPVFTQWLVEDKQRVILPFLHKFNQLRRLRNIVDAERPYYTSELKQLIDMSHIQLLGQIATLGGDEALGKLDELYPSTPPDSALTASFRSDAATAFWATFVERLPSYEPVISLLADFIHRYGRILPTRGDLLTQLTEQLDLEFIREQIENKVVTLQQLQSYLRLLLDHTKQLSSPSDETVLEVQLGPLTLIERTEGDVSVVNGIRAFITPLFQQLDKLETIVSNARYERDRQTE